MSASKRMRQCVRNASDAQLAHLEHDLERAIASERNPMKRASYRLRLDIVHEEQQARDLAAVAGKVGA